MSSLLRVAQQRAKVAPSSQNMSSYQSMSLSLHHTSQVHTHFSGHGEKFTCWRPFFRIHTCLFLRKALVLSLQYQSRHSLYLSKEKGCQPHECKHTMGQSCMPSRQCLWMDVAKISWPLSLNLCQIVLSTAGSGLSGEPHLYTGEIIDAHSFGGKWFVNP